MRDREALLLAVSAKSRTIPESEQLRVRRSSRFQLKDQKGREKALRMIIGVLEHIKSGTSEVGVIQAAPSYDFGIYIIDLDKARLVIQF